MQRNKKKKHNTEKISILLTKEDIQFLNHTLSRGVHKARTIIRARILLYSHKGKTNKEIVDALGCVPRIICDVRRRYHQHHSITEAIYDAPRSGQPKKVTVAHEAFVIATACTDAPDGHSHWTLPALRDKLLATHDDLKSVSDERIRQMLIRATLKPWREKNVVHPKTHPRVSRTHG
jgi:Homeodomain-like domain